jgi:hypothetical protein
MPIPETLTCPAGYTAHGRAPVGTCRKTCRRAGRARRAGRFGRVRRELRASSARPVGIPITGWRNVLSAPSRQPARLAGGGCWHGSRGCPACFLGGAASQCGGTRACRRGLQVGLSPGHAGGCRGRAAHDGVSTKGPFKKNLLSLHPPPTASFLRIRAAAPACPPPPPSTPAHRRPPVCLGRPGRIC